MKNILSKIVFILVLSTGKNSIAQRTYSNQSLAHILNANKEDNKKLVVAGYIRKVNLSENYLTEFAKGYSKIDFAIQSILLNDGNKVGLNLKLDITSFSWPEKLVPLKSGEFCILVLEKKYSTKEYFLEVVVPAHSKKFNTVINNTEAKKLLSKEILTELEHESNSKRQEELIKQVTSVLKSKDAEKLIPFLKSENIWVKRAAMAGLVYVTEEEKYIKMTALDIQSFFSRYKEGDLMEEMDNEKGIRHDPYAYYLNYFFFLDKRTWTNGSKWDNNEAEKHSRIFNSIENTGLVKLKIINLLK